MSDGPLCDENRIPARPATVPEKIRDSHVQPPTRTPDNRAATPFPPVAYMYRPAGVRSRNHQLMSAMMMT